MKLLGRRFYRYGHKVYIADGVNPVRYFDLKRFKLVKFSKDWLKK